jgi:transposase
VLKRETRTAILELAARGIGKRAIARTLGISRRSLQKVLASGLAEPPALLRPHKAAAHREQILVLHASCRGNLVRVREELLAQGVDLSYQALTSFCRHSGIGTEPKTAAGHYHFDPGQEMQHDTSPHTASIGGRNHTVHSASAVLAYSGMMFFQAYPRFRRFECKVLLTEACRYFGGAPARIMIDNTHVVVLRGTGAAMVPVPEMVAFAERFGFLFRAHEKGDANRSARVERPFHFIEHNFFAGRSFTDLEDLNAQARQWCDQVNQRYVRSRRARPSELFAVERTALREMPVWVPDPYELARRSVDVDGFVTFDTNRYSVPEDWIGDPVEIRATLSQITLDHSRRGAVVHRRLLWPEGRHLTLPEHRRPRTKRPAPTDRELAQLKEQAPELIDYAQQLIARGKKQPTLALRKMLHMIRDFPRAPLRAAFAEAQRYGLFDLDRIETMVLRRIATDFFRFEGDQRS